MIKKEVAELKKRMKYDKTNIDRVAGCYVNGSKEKVATFSKSFLSLEEDEQNRYLEIAKKCLSGKLGNNLIELEFPLDEEKEGGSQYSLLQLRDSGLKDEDLLDTYYDKIIETYNNPENYLIVLFHEVYDVPMKAKDMADLGESEVVFDYIIGAICPVAQAKGGLGYKETDGVAVINGNMMVRPPETGFLFPCFNDRQADIHSTLMFTKDTNEPHMEFMNTTMACPEKVTDDITRTTIEDMIEHELSLSGEGEDVVAEKILLFHKGLHDKLEEYNAQGAVEAEIEAVEMDEDIVEDILKDIEVGDEIAENVSIAYKKEYKDNKPYISKVCNESLLTKEALLLENIELKKRISVLAKKLNEKA